ncbi:hypothetical protein JK386_09530 [Nocardioides sp. zg-536]|uniref:Uncharacterized protein n=1 Tax=Nocardioides faecalis TaxID=2803858 RepID=A0A938YA86_9ACTN|nr:hypothetical protein [Nocardioides faecalis]MBM9460144.1 hypothetical protein [Nocardioides faecalis]QVI60061.1 hypothetical protein KG111_07075 [Nocardioides faecalis]
MSAAPSENVAALMATLSDRVPGAVRRGVGVGEVDAGRESAAAIEAVLDEVARINQTLLTLLDDVSPGAVSASDEVVARVGT